VSAATPYPEPDGTATTGWSGSEASHDRAIEERDNGTASERQRRTMQEVCDLGVYGITVKDLRDITGWPHGQASSTLSVLHKEGRLERLKDRRDRCHIYVHPTDVRGRETQPHGRQKPDPLTEYERATLKDIEADLEHGFVPIRRKISVVTEALRRLADG
jgi:DNA-binding MarR family transcriptional regulator